MSHREDNDAVGTYFQTRWTEYEKVVANDYLGHRALFEAAHEALRARMQRPYAMLDLGCGDARFTRRLVEGTPITSWVGVDLSDTALVLAERNMEGVCGDVVLHIGDAFTSHSADGETFDVVFASYSLHHLPADRKREALRDIRGRLAPDGCFLLLDLTQEGKTMEEARARMSAYVARDWAALEPDERATTRQHIESADFIETPTWLLEAGREAGFGDCRVLVLDPRGYTGAFAFYP